MDQMPLITLQNLLKKHITQEQQHEKFENYFTELGSCRCHNSASQQAAIFSCLKTVRIENINVYNNFLSYPYFSLIIFKVLLKYQQILCFIQHLRINKVDIYPDLLEYVEYCITKQI